MEDRDLLVDVLRDYVKERGIASEIANIKGQLEATERYDNVVGQVIDTIQHRQTSPTTSTIIRRSPTGGRTATTYNLTPAGNIRHYQVSIGNQNRGRGRLFFGQQYQGFTTHRNSLER